MLRQERENRTHRFRVVIVCVVLGVVLGIWHNRRADSGRPNFVTGTIRAVTAPVVNGASSVGEWTGRQFGWLFRGRALAEENRRLRAENGRLRQEAAALREADTSARRLRQQLGFQETLPPTRLAADVLSYRPSPSFATMVLSRGSRDGVRPRGVVVTSRGLVGQVFDVGPTTSAVLLLTDASAAVGGRVQREASRAAGVCRGTGGEMLSLNYLDRGADVKPGDTIVSSGLGGEQGVFPPGIPIGEVVGVENEASGATKRVEVRPFVTFHNLEEVYILQ